MYSLFLQESDYGSDWSTLFPTLSQGRSQAGQAVAQLASVFTTIAVACVGGSLTGLIMKLATNIQFRLLLSLVFNFHWICFSGRKIGFSSKPTLDDQFNFVNDDETDIEIRFPEIFKNIDSGDQV